MSSVRAVLALPFLIVPLVLSAPWGSSTDPVPAEPDAIVVEGVTWPTSTASTSTTVGSSPSATTAVSVSAMSMTGVSPLPSTATQTRGDISACPAVIVEAFGARASEACAVAWCESKYDPGAIGDHGNSLGLFQLWKGWAPWAGYTADQLLEPAVNATVALKVLGYRERWSGEGGWSCADALGIP